MRIRPWVATATVTVVAVTALGIIVTANDPSTAPALVMVLFWTTLVLSGWGVFATVLLFLRCDIAQATWCGVIMAGGLVGIAVLVHTGNDDRRLLGGIVFATLSLAFVAWYRLRGRT